MKSRKNSKSPNPSLKENPVIVSNLLRILMTGFVLGEIGNLEYIKIRMGLISYPNMKFEGHDSLIEKFGKITTTTDGKKIFGNSAYWSLNYNREEIWKFIEKYYSKKDIKDIKEYIIHEEIPYWFERDYINEKDIDFIINLMYEFYIEKDIPRRGYK